MKYIEKITDLDIELVGQEMRNGKIVVFPTETVYGIGTNACDENACRKIYELKQRPSNKPLIVLISDMDMLCEIVQDINDIEKKLIEKFWPGPLTIIFEKKSNAKLTDIVTAGQKSVGVRMTDGKVARMLIQKAGVPIVAPSANLSGKPSATKMKNIMKDLGDKVDYILDCGDIKDETTSTLVKVENEVIHILRQGKISKGRLEEATKVKVML